MVDVHPEVVVLHDEPCNRVNNEVAQTNPHVYRLELVQRAIVVVVVDEEAYRRFWLVSVDITQDN